MVRGGADRDMSPVLIPRTYTKRFIDGEITVQEQADAITAALGRISASSDAVLMEGTGHVGVGSIVDMSNSQVAALAGAECVLVANGGLGSAFDDLELNRNLLEKHGVRLRGVVVNKVLPDKVDMMTDYFGRLVEGRWKVHTSIDNAPDNQSQGSAGGYLAAGRYAPYTRKHRLLLFVCAARRGTGAAAGCRYRPAGAVQADAGRPRAGAGRGADGGAAVQACALWGRAYLGRHHWRASLSASRTPQAAVSRDAAPLHHALHA